MTERLLEREQFFDAPVERTFAPFADAGNLEAITPPWLRFQISGLFARVRYRAGFGPFGDAAHALFVGRDLARIFDYRREAVLDLVSG